MGFEDEERPPTSGTTFTPSVLKDFRCDLETDCRCSPEMRPNCEYNVKTRPARDSAVYDHGLTIAQKAEQEKQTASYEVNSPMAARLLVLLFLTAAAVVVVTWHFGEWIRYSIQ